MNRLDLSEPDVVHLKLPNKMTYANIGAVLDQLEPMFKSGDEAQSHRIALDLRSVVFCSPTAITILAAGVETLWQEKKFVSGQIWPPNNPFALQYLQRMDFFNELQVPFQEDFKRHSPRGFRPVTHVPNEQVSPAVTRDVVEAVSESHDIDSSTTGALKNCVNELIENVFYHAKSPTDALVSVQAYKKKGRTEIVIADTGRGIRPCLADVDEYRERVTDDYSAIELAIQKNVTATGDIRRGIGLWVVSELVRRNEGEMLILSNEGGVEIHSDGLHRRDNHYWPGTLITIEFRMDMPIDTKAVYDSGDFPDADSFDF